MFKVGQKADSGGFENYQSLKMLQEKGLLPSIIKYCQMDCKLLYDVYIAFRLGVNEFLKGDIIPQTFVSASSLAFQIWLKNYYKFDSKEPIFGLYRTEYEEVKKSYFGGLTQVYRRHLVKGYYYDINSSYPSVMCGKTPISLHKIVERMELKGFTPEKTLDDHFYLYKLESFRFPKSCFFPSIPIRTKEGNFYLLEASKPHEIWVWDHLLKNIIKETPNFEYVIESAFIFKSGDIFSEMINTVYPLKSSENPALKAFAKLLMNSVYGKTGQKLFPTRKIHGCFLKDNSIEEVVKHIQSLDRTYSDENPASLVGITRLQTETTQSFILDYDKSSETPTHPGSLMFIASFITSRARLKLLEMMQICEKEGNHVYYVDTDSIFVQKKFNPRYVDQSVLGLWKLEDEIKEARFFGSKSYVYTTESGKEVKKFKGIPREVLKGLDLWSLSDEQMTAILEQTWLKKWGYVENKPSSKVLKETLNRRVYLGQKDSKPFKNLAEII
jgi:hypothetical protein